jgi:hypothetical protein
VIGWGENQFGQVSVPATAPPIAAIDCGFHFSIAVTDGQLPRYTARATTRLAEGDQLELEFSSRRGEACFLQYTDAIEDPSWTLLSGRLALGPNSRFTDVTRLVPQRFYWIRVRP